MDSSDGGGGVAVDPDCVECPGGAARVVVGDGAEPESEDIEEDSVVNQYYVGIGVAVAVLLFVLLFVV